MKMIIPTLWCVILFTFLCLFTFSVIAQVDTTSPSFCRTSNNAQNRTDLPVPPDLTSNIASQKAFSLEQALDLSRSSSPDLQRAKLELLANQAEVNQVSSYQNPVLALAVDNIYGNKSYRDLESAEWTLSIEQTFQMAKKRSQQIAVAQAQMLNSQQDCAVLLRQMELLTAQRFYEYQLATRLQHFSQQALDVAKELYNITQKRVEFGSSAQLELDQIKTDLARVNIEAINAKQLVTKQIYALKALWSDQNLPALTDLPLTTSFSSNPLFINDEALLNASQQSSVESLKNHPLYRQTMARTRLSKERLKFAVAEKTPDLTLSFGVKHFDETDDNGLVAGFSLPLPILDRRQGSIQAASARDTAQQVSQAQVLKKLYEDSQLNYTNWLSVKDKYHLSEQELLPQSERAYKQALKAYKVGKYDLVKVLAARQTLFQSQIDMIRIEFERSLAEIKLRDLYNLYPFSSTDQYQIKNISMEVSP